MNGRMLAVTLALLVFSTPVGARDYRAAYVPQPGGEAALPQAIAFDMVLAGAPDANGHFVVACRISARLARTGLAVEFIPGEGVEIIDEPEKLRGRLAPERPLEFLVTAKRTKAVGRGMLRARLRYRYPRLAAIGYTKADPHGRYAEERVKGKALRRLAEMSDDSIQTINRVLFVD